VTEVSEGIGADLGFGLLVRVDRLGAKGVTGAGAGAGAGEDSFRRFAGFGEARAGEDVGSARDTDEGAADAEDAGAAEAESLALFPERL